MRLHAVCYYRSNSDTWTDGWRDVDYTARNLVKAVKQSPFKGFSSLTTLAGRVLKIDNTPSGQEIARRFAAQMLAKKIEEAGYNKTTIIPVPSSSHIKPGADFTGARLARAIEDRNSNFKAMPVLYFDKPVPKSSGGGGRNAELIQSTLRATDDIKTITTAVLLDDVYTSGAHMKAVVRFLSGMGIEIADAFVVGRTAWEKPASMFKCACEEIPIATNGLPFL